MALGAPAHAEDRITLGWGRLFVNDALGDGEDRWRTGAYTVSIMRGTGWSGALPQTFGELLEIRLRGETIAPANLVRAAPGDRRYVGALSLGLHTHFDLLGNEATVGGDLVFTGPQTGVSRFQDWAHDVLDMDDPQVFGDQIGNGIHPTLSAEIGRSLPLAERVTLRPFAAAQMGVESLVRVGGDLVFGGFGQGAMMLRDTTTGQRHRAIESDRIEGFSFTLGADFARVFDSEYLPDGEPAVMSDTRSRVRAGMHWQGQRASVFYGVTWLGKEFEDQPDDQVVGALNLNLSF